MEQPKYDVFISYSRKDYVKDDKVIPGNPITAIQDLFDKNGISYWFDKDGIYSGEEFVKEIANAIVNSKMLLFVSSKYSNESEYTCGEILKAKKAKKLIIPFLIDDCDYNAKFEILLLPLNHIDFVAQPQTAFPELLRTVKKEKERLRLVEEKQNEDLLKEQKKKEISAGVKDFQRLNGEQDFLLRSLYSKSKEVGAKTKKCPVCDAEQPVDVPYCESCGWHYASLYGVYGVDSKSLHDEKQLRIVRGLWKDLIDGKDSNKRLKEISAILEDERKQKELFAKRSDMLMQDAHSLMLEAQTLQDELKVKEEEKQELEHRVKNIEQENKKLKSRVEEAEKKEAERKRREEEERAKEKTFTVGGVSFKMIRVEGGDMGTFYIGETQVTQALWKAIMGNNPSYFKGEDHPVENVSWNDICGKDGTGTDPNCFLYKLNQQTGMKFRLPKESEWEYAAKGGNKSKNYTYAGSDSIDKVAWYGKNSGDKYLEDSEILWKDWLKIEKNNSKTHPVKQLSPNEIGIYDMSGNVWEWCQDLYGSGGSGRVNRGGSWDSNAKYCRVAYRSYNAPTSTFKDVGLRLAQ